MPAARDGSGLDQEGWEDDGYGVDRGARAGQVAAAHRRTAARLVRLNRVWRRLDERRPLDWGQVAADAGYADQAHLIRDFHQFTGTTPTQFQARSLPSHGDAEQEVNSVQDAVAAVS